MELHSAQMERQLRKLSNAAIRMQAGAGRKEYVGGEICDASLRQNPTENVASIDFLLPLRLFTTEGEIKVCMSC